MFLNKLPGHDTRAQLTCEQIRSLLIEVVDELEQVADANNLRQASMLNFVLTDGEHTVCTRYLRDPDGTQAGAATLYFAAGAGYECVDERMGVYRVSHSDRRHRVVIVASEPLTNTTSDWLPVPPNYTLTVTREIDVLLAPISDRSLVCHPVITDCLTRHNIPPTAHDATATRLPLVVGHHDLANNANVLCCEIVGSLIFAGTNASVISVWDANTWTRVCDLRGHNDAVLSLASTATAQASTAVGGSTQVLFRCACVWVWVMFCIAAQLSSRSVCPAACLCLCLCLCLSTSVCLSLSLCLCLHLHCLHLVPCISSPHHSTPPVASS